jgi:putative transposase
MSLRKIPWPHAPTHQISQAGTYFVTAATYLKAHYFSTPQRLSVLQRGLLGLAQDYQWRLEAWAIFSNHYHFIGHSPDKDASKPFEVLGGSPQTDVRVD